LKWIVGKDGRAKQLQLKAARNIEGYNREMPPEERLPYWVVVVRARRPDDGVRR
jgi:DNA segregation ATPase FtsK/SpoIIIE-like protein